VEQRKEIDIEQVIEDDEIERQIEAQESKNELRKALIKSAKRKTYRDQILLRINHETHEALTRVSAEMGLKKATVVREILRNGLVMLGEEIAEEIDPLTEFRLKIAQKLGVK
jgi:predicted DNA-binding protein